MDFLLGLLPLRFQLAQEQVLRFGRESFWLALPAGIPSFCSRLAGCIFYQGVSTSFLDRESDEGATLQEDKLYPLTNSRSTAPAAALFLSTI